MFFDLEIWENARMDPSWPQRPPPPYFYVYLCSHRLKPSLPSSYRLRLHKYTVTGRKCLKGRKEKKKKKGNSTNQSVDHCQRVWQRFGLNNALKLSGVNRSNLTRVISHCASEKKYLGTRVFVQREKRILRCSFAEILITSRAPTRPRKHTHTHTKKIK